MSGVASAVSSIAYQAVSSPISRYRDALPASIRAKLLYSKPYPWLGEWEATSGDWDATSGTAEYSAHKLPGKTETNYAAIYAAVNDGSGFWYDSNGDPVARLVSEILDEIRTNISNIWCNSSGRLLIFDGTLIASEILVVGRYMGLHYPVLQNQSELLALWDLSAGDGVITSSIGGHTGDPQPLQLLNLTSSITFYSSTIVGTETVTNQGTSSATVSVGSITVGAGTAWELTDGTRLWVFCAELSADTVVLWDVSGNGDHLLATGLTTGQVSECCSTSLVSGSDRLNQYGWCVADGNQYLHPVSMGLIPDEVLIPNISVSTCCAYEVV